MIRRYHAARVCLLLTVALLPAAEDVSAQCTPPVRSVELIAVDGGGRRDTVFFGHDPAATRGIDTALCERELPPPPPGGAYDLRFANPPGHDGTPPPAGLGQGCVRDYRTQTGPLQIDTFRVRFQPGAGGFPITFSWSPAALGAICDSAWLIDETGGAQVNVRMHVAASLVMNNPALTSLLVFKFGVVEIPGAPTLVTPINGALNQDTSVTLVWNAVPGSLRYVVQVSADSLFASMLLNDSAVAATARSVHGLLPATSYFWRVRAANGAGVGPWSVSRRFTTIALPETPVLISPLNAATGLPATALLLWHSATRAAGYRAQLSVDSLFVTTVIDNASLVDTSLTTMALSPSTRYFWRVAGRNGAGEGPWSVSRNFTTAGAVTNQYLMQQGWNMISLPLSVSDGRTVMVYPTAISSAFAYGVTGYVSADTLRNGSGYWLKFASAQSVGITGLVRALDTLQLNAGWNLIGTISTPVDTGSVQQLPPGLLSTSYFVFTNSYIPADTLVPGKSYWVKARTAGVLVISSGIAVPGAPSSPYARTLRPDP